MNKFTIGKPNITLEESGRLVSSRFDDVYYSIKDGLEETRYVFLKHNELEERWCNQKEFRVIEFGFGTGLNFLATLDLWKKSSKCTLDYTSIEKFPIDKGSLSQILKRWEELDEYTEALLDVYPDCEAGVYTFEFEAGKVKLTLIFADVQECLAILPKDVDAWYLDGFDPKKNPDMWSDDVYHTIGQNSKIGSTIATFTAAGQVKRALRANGFKLKRVDGFGPKWHMLKGWYVGDDGVKIV